MNILPQNQAADIVKQFDGNPWVELLDIAIPAEYESVLTADDKLLMNKDTSSHYHILMTNSNNNCIVYHQDWAWGEMDDWEMWLAVPYERDEIADSQDSYGEVNTQISLGDMGNFLMTYMKKFKGMVGFPVRMIQAMAVPNYIEHTPPTPPSGIPPYAVVEKSGLAYDFVVGNASHDRNNFTIALESALPLEWRFPYRRIIKASCQWCFKSAECGYTGNDATCQHTIADCRAKGNILRFGAFPGCGRGGLGQ